MADATCILNGGFKPTMKRFADLSGPDFFPTPASELRKSLMKSMSDWTCRLSFFEQLPPEEAK
jgi:hypothetical protein